jgi:hypothetical protein
MSFYLKTLFFLIAKIIKGKYKQNIIIGLKVIIPLKKDKIIILIPKIK